MLVGPELPHVAVFVMRDVRFAPLPAHAHTRHLNVLRLHSMPTHLITTRTVLLCMAQRWPTQVYEEAVGKNTAWLQSAGPSLCAQFAAAAASG